MKTVTYQSFLKPRISAVLMVLMLLGSVAAKTQVTAVPSKASSASFPAYPVKVSANGRYLVDQKNTPFLIAGDSPQGLISRLSETQAESYFADRQVTDSIRQGG